MKPQKNGASNLLNAGTLVAYAEDKPGDPIKVEAQTINIGGLDITVDNLYVHGGAGMDVGHYPIILDYSGMTIDTTINGEKIDLTKVVEIELDTVMGETEKYNVNPDIKKDEDIIGWLHVSKRKTDMFSDSDSKPYDGTTLTAEHVSETAYDKDSNKGFVPGEGDNPPPDPDPDPDTPTTTTVVIPIPVAVVAPSPVAAVLGARRETPVSGAAVLGARRAATEDTTNEGMRVLVVVIASGIAISLLFFGKKKENDEV
ncbi:hypothetical protein [Butyrivibrio proteoclasticus]|nr:hypothetical protein [Butyrivibrio proteoclasticus]